jgi:hypothetical protein
LHGARAVHQLLVKEAPNASLAAMIVWVEMLPEDKDADLTALSDHMYDPRVRWFHDPLRRAGKAIATALGAPDKTAWDVYLFFDRDVQWKGGPPQPRGWTHQLGDTWADPDRYRAGEQLSVELASLLADVGG